MTDDKNIAALTGLRFIAAFMVFFSHFPIPGATGTLLTFNLSGYAGVTCFFVLSGFVISYHYFSHFQSPDLFRTWNYCVARFARIFPLYLFVLLTIWSRSKSHIDLTPYLLGIQAWSSHLSVAFGIVGPAWSISVEIFLYATFPLLAFFFSKTNLFSTLNRIVAIFVIITLLLFVLPTYFSLTGRSALPWPDPHSAHRWLYLMPLTRLLDFSLGMTAAAIFKKFGNVLSSRSTFSSSIGYLALLIIAILMVNGKFLHSAYSFDSAYAIPFCFLILSLAINRTSFISTILSYAPLILLGEVSYAFYLIHMPIGRLLYSKPFFEMNQMFYWFGLIMLIGMAYGLHKIIEVPCRVLLRHLFSVDKTSTVFTDSLNSAPTTLSQ